MGLFVVEVAEAWPGVGPQAPPPTWCPWRPGCSWAPPCGPRGERAGGGAATQDTPSGSGGGGGGASAARRPRAAPGSRTWSAPLNGDQSLAAACRRRCLAEADGHEHTCGRAPPGRVCSGQRCPSPASRCGVSGDTRPRHTQWLGSARRDARSHQGKCGGSHAAWMGSARPGGSHAAGTGPARPGKGAPELFPNRQGGCCRLEP